MNKNFQCTDGHIFKNGSQVDGFFYFHFDQYPAYKIRGWTNKIATWVFILLVTSTALWFTNIYGNPTLNIILTIIIMVLWMSALIPFDNALSNLLYPVFNPPADKSRFKIYPFIPKTVNGIAYKKQIFWPGYLVTIPSFKAKIEYEGSTEPIFTIEKHTISCVKNIEILKEMIEKAKIYHS